MLTYRRYWDYGRASPGCAWTGVWDLGTADMPRSRLPACILADGELWMEDMRCIMTPVEVGQKKLQIWTEQSLESVRISFAAKTSRQRRSNPFRISAHLLPNLEDLDNPRGSWHSAAIQKIDIALCLLCLMRIFGQSVPWWYMMCVVLPRQHSDTNAY